MQKEINSEKRHGIIETELLCKSYVSDGEVNHVIKNLNLAIDKKDFTVIMGSSGSGKSTLLYLLSGMLASTSGSVCWSGQDITKLKEKQMAKFRRDRLGFVFQAMNLVPDLTAFENVLSPAYKNGKGREETEKRANQLLEMMELTEHKKKFPNQLSGGQRQRVAICRALMNEPDVLFADEPTGALNSAQSEKVLDIFSKIHNEGQAVMMVTHDLKAALRGNRIIYLRDGRVDGDLNLEEFDKERIEEREALVYNFLKERGW